MPESRQEHCLRRAIAGLLASFALLLILTAPTPVDADGSLAAALLPSSGTVAPRDTVEVTLKLDSATPTRGAQASLDFDATMLQCDGFMPGDYYSTWAALNGANVLWWGVPPTIETTIGTVSNIAVSLLGGTGGPTGSGSFGTYRFTAIAEGTACVSIAGCSAVAVDGSLVAVSCTGATVAVYSDDVVTIPDANHEAVVRAATGIPSGDIRESDLTSLANLDGSLSGIRQLDGLEACTGLSHLNLEDNSVEDLSPLVSNAGLDRGDTVLLSGNPLNLNSLYTHVPALESRGIWVEYDTPVQPVWDLDGNHVCGLFDVLAVGSEWNATGAPRWIPQDLDSSGYIDLFDILLVAENWGAQW